jgi:hypothetical protein
VNKDDRRSTGPAAMNRMESIAQAVASLTDDELTALRNWFAAFDEAAGDRKLVEDTRAGKLDQPADEALRDLQAGRCTGL